MFLYEMSELNKKYKCSSSQNAISRDEENEGLPKGTRQLKLPPDKQGSSSKALNRNRTTRVKLDHKSLNFVPACEVTGITNSPINTSRL